MTQSRHANEYRKNAINGASPLRLVIMLYDGALKHMEAGKAAMSKKDLQGQNEQLQKAQRIVMELMSALDMAKGGEIAQNLLALYTFVLEQLVQANIDDKPGPIDQAIHTLSELREGWVKVEAGFKKPARDYGIAA